jgi:hypothetical protein
MTLAGVHRSWRLHPQAAVEGQQSNRNQAPDQAVEPGHSGWVAAGVH